MTLKHLKSNKVTHFNILIIIKLKLLYKLFMKVALINYGPPIFMFVPCISDG